MLSALIVVYASLALFGVLSFARCARTTDEILASHEAALLAAKSNLDPETPLGHEPASRSESARSSSSPTRSVCSVD